jgi:hypothetical protein
MQIMKRINSITVKTEYDTDPDLSWLGEIHEDPRRPFDIKCDHYWFTPGQHWPHNPTAWKHVTPESKNFVLAKYGSLKSADYHYALQDMKRLQDYYTGRWYMTGVIVTAKIAISEDGDHWAHEKITNALGGIESDSTKEYKQEIINNLKSEVKEQLNNWGFNNCEIAAAMSLTEAR